MKEDGFYWIKLRGEWEIAEVVTVSDKSKYVFTCGWEVPIPPEDIIWGLRILPPCE